MNVHSNYKKKTGMPTHLDNGVNAGGTIIQIVHENSVD